MTRMTYRLTAVLAVIGILGAATGSALADTTLIYQGPTDRLRVDMRPGEIRIGGTGDGWQLYTADSDTVFSVNPGERRYTRMDKNTARAIKARMDALRDRIDQRVQQLPESKRDTARQALYARMPELDSGTHKLGLDRTSATDTVAGVPCTIVQVVRDGKPAQALCVAGADALNIAPATFATVKSMFALLRTMLAGTGFQAVGLPYLNLSGMPLSFTQTSTGARHRLIEVSHGELPDSRFSIPDGYTEQTPDMPGQ